MNNKKKNPQTIISNLYESCSSHTIKGFSSTLVLYSVDRIQRCSVNGEEGSDKKKKKSDTLKIACSLLQHWKYRASCTFQCGGLIYIITGNFFFVHTTKNQSAWISAPRYFTFILKQMIVGITVHWKLQINNFLDFCLCNLPFTYRPFTSHQPGIVLHINVFTWTNKDNHILQVSSRW